MWGGVGLFCLRNTYRIGQHRLTSLPLGSAGFVYHGCRRQNHRVQFNLLPFPLTCRYRLNGLPVCTAVRQQDRLLLYSWWVEYTYRGLVEFEHCNRPAFVQSRIYAMEPDTAQQARLHYCFNEMSKRACAPASPSSGVMEHTLSIAGLSTAHQRCIPWRVFRETSKYSAEYGNNALCYSWVFHSVLCGI